MHLSTRIYTWLHGEFVGTDTYGNRYYRGRKPNRHGQERRWVLYKGRPEASKVPPEWHSWLHGTTDAPLTEGAARRKPWQQEHIPNLTGTQGAFVPSGHDTRGGQRAAATGDYESWSPS